MRPCPFTPQASSPSTGSITVTPRAFSAAMFSCVTGLSHMPVFIAGAIAIGARVARSVAVRRLSASPYRIFAIVFAVAGATSARLHVESAMCSGFQLTMGANCST